MQRPPVPGSVTLGRVLLIIESVLWLLAGLAVARLRRAGVHRGGEHQQPAGADRLHGHALHHRGGGRGRRHPGGGRGGDPHHRHHRHLVGSGHGPAHRGTARHRHRALPAWAWSSGSSASSAGCAGAPTVTTGTTTLRDTPIPGIVILRRQPADHLGLRLRPQRAGGVPLAAHRRLPDDGAGGVRPGAVRPGDVRVAGGAPVRPGGGAGRLLGRPAHAGGCDPELPAAPASATAAPGGPELRLAPRGRPRRPPEMPAS